MFSYQYSVVGCRVLLGRILSIILPVPLATIQLLPAANSSLLPRALRERARFPLYETHNTDIIKTNNLSVSNIPGRTRNLAEQTTPRSSAHSCLDLSTLQISSLSQPPNGAAVDPPGASEGQTFTAPTSRSPSPDTPSFRSDSQKLVSKRKRVTKKARGVLGKVRAFQRIAAAKMAHPNIKIDTSVQATKRSHPDNEEGAEIIDGPEDDNPQLEMADNELVPPFLRQSILGWFALCFTGHRFTTTKFARLIVYFCI